MQHLGGEARQGEARANLQQASRVPGRDDIRPYLADGVDLAFLEHLGHLRVGQVVDAGGAAAVPVPRQIDELEARDGAQERAGRLGNPLAVEQMVGVMENVQEFLEHRSQIGSIRDDVHLLSGEAALPRPVHVEREEELG